MNERPVEAQKMGDVERGLREALEDAEAQRTRLTEWLKSAGPLQMVEWVELKDRSIRITYEGKGGPLSLVLRAV